MKLYPDVEKEMSFDDYKPLPPLRGLSVAELQELKGNLLDAAENAFVWHCDLLELAINADVAKTDLYIRMYEKKEGKKNV